LADAIEVGPERHARLDLRIAQRRALIGRRRLGLQRRPEHEDEPDHGRGEPDRADERAGDAG
jgi:hypothetical protein